MCSSDLEIYNANQPDEVESVFVGTPVIVTLTDYTTQGIKVIRDTGTKKWNDGTGGGLTATHWQVYISPVQTDASVTPSLSSFVRLGAPIAIDGTAAQSFTFGGTGNYASTNIQNLRSARSTQVWGGAGTVDAFTSASNCAMTTLTTLGAAIASAVATNIQVASSASLSSGMVVRIEEEQFLISGIPDGTHFDCVGGRGYNNTTATTHVINSTVYAANADDGNVATATRQAEYSLYLSQPITSTGQTDIRVTDRSLCYVNQLLAIPFASGTSTEEMLVTAVTGSFADSITVTRGYNGTSATTFAAAAQIYPFGPSRDVGFETIQYSFTAPASTIIGIGVTITGTQTISNPSGLGTMAPMPLYVSIVKNGGTASTERVVPFNVLGTKDTLTVGGQSDIWGFGSISSTDIADSGTPASGFRVRIRWKRTDSQGTIVNGAAFSGAPAGASASLSIDAVRVTLYAQPLALVTGADYPTITLQTDAGYTLVQSANGKGPVSSTGDLYDGALVQNDVTRKNRVWWSLPDAIEYVPSLYYVDFPTDAVTAIRRVGSACLIGMRGRIMRFNYLPSTVDPTFSRGRPWDILASDHGMVSPQATCMVEWPGKGTVLLYVSYDGIHLTDGVSTELLTDALDWGSLVSLSTPATDGSFQQPSYLSNAVLVAYPKQKWVVMYYTPAGGTTNKIGRAHV